MYFLFVDFELLLCLKNSFTNTAEETTNTTNEVKNNWLLLENDNEPSFGLSSCVSTKFAIEARLRLGWQVGAEARLTDNLGLSCAMCKAQFSSDRLTLVSG